MAIYLGNQTISDLERRTGYKFSEEDRKWLEFHRQNEADIKFDSDKFHIFDIPFSIHASSNISDYLLKLLMKYEEQSPSKEQLQFSVIKETEEEKEKRLKKEKEEQEWQNKLNNPNSVWNIKWHMLVPVDIKYMDVIRNLYYGCFINTYTKGRNNIPNIINGKATIYLDEEGFHGRFSLDNPEIDSDARYEYTYVIGTGFYTHDGSYLGNMDNITFEETTFYLQDAINEYQDVNNFSSKEIHFNSIMN